MKHLIFLFSGLILFSCGSEINNNNNDFFIDSVLNKSTQILKGVEISKRIVKSFIISDSSGRYHLPVYSFYNDSINIKDFKYFDIIKYAKSKGVDSVDANNYVKNYSHKIQSTFESTQALEILSRPEFGDFIFFQYPEKYLIYIFPNGEIKSPFWKQRLQEAKIIKPNWVLRD